MTGYARPLAIAPIRARMLQILCGSHAQVLSSIEPGMLDDFTQALTITWLSGVGIFAHPQHTLALHIIDGAPQLVRVLPGSMGGITLRHILAILRAQKNLFPEDRFRLYPLREHTSLTPTEMLDWMAGVWRQMLATPGRLAASCHWAYPTIADNPIVPLYDLKQMGEAISLSSSASASDIHTWGQLARLSPRRLVALLLELALTLSQDALDAQRAAWILDDPPMLIQGSILELIQVCHLSYRRRASSCCCSCRCKRTPQLLRHCRLCNLPVCPRCWNSAKDCCHKCAPIPTLSHGPRGTGTKACCCACDCPHTDRPLQRCMECWACVCSGCWDSDGQICHACSLRQIDDEAIPPLSRAVQDTVRPFSSAPLDVFWASVAGRATLNGSLPSFRARLRLKLMRRAQDLLTTYGLRW